MRRARTKGSAPHSWRAHRPPRCATAVLSAVAWLAASPGCANQERLTGVTAPTTQPPDGGPTTSSSTLSTPATSDPPATEPSTGATTTTAGASPTTTTTAAPPTTSPPTTAALVAGTLLALDVLGSIRVENEHRGGYVRDAFGYPADLDGDSCTTRAEVLQDEATGLVQIDQPACLVREGDWISLYDGLAVTDAAELEIDHVVALKEAWDSGAWRWDPMTMVAFGNDLTDERTLRAVTSSTNRSKSDKDPSNWLPPAPSAVCEYLGDWVSIKARWSLTMDQSEYGRIRNVLRGDCAGTTILPFEVVASTRRYLDRPFAAAP